jgi:DNA-binding NtrC family response regulator
MRRTSLYRKSVEDFERRYLNSELERHAWNRAQTARDLGLNYRTINYKIERLQLTPPDKEFPESVSA